MTRHALVLMIVLLTGCGPTLPRETSVPPRNEQLYIDAKRGFSISHPLTWTKKTIPVSSLNFREDTVTWQVAGAASHRAEFSVAIAPLPRCRDLGEYSKTVLGRTLPLADIRTETASHPLGKAVKGRTHRDTQDLLFTSVSSRTACYCLVLSSPSSLTTELEPIFSAVVGSLQEIR